MPRKQRILIVEGYEDHRKALAEFLEIKGYEVVTCGTLPNAVEVHQRRGFDAYIVCLETGEANDWANGLIEKGQKHVIQYVTHSFEYRETRCHLVLKTQTEELLAFLPSRRWKLILVVSPTLERFSIIEGLMPLSSTRLVHALDFEAARTEVGVRGAEGFTSIDLVVIAGFEEEETWDFVHELQGQGQKAVIFLRENPEGRDLVCTSIEDILEVFWPKP